MALSAERRWGRAAGWGAGLLAVVVAIFCVRLGFWQLDRLEQRRALNATVERGLSTPPVVLDKALLDSLSLDPDAFAYRRVRAVGSYADTDLILRGRSHDGGPGVHLVTPFRFGGSASPLLVNRGWLPAPDGATADPRPFRQSGAIEVEGILQLLPDGVDDAVPARIEVQGDTIDSFRRLDRSILTGILGQAPVTMYLQLTAGSASGEEAPIPVPVPELDEGPHLGYAIQWFSFAGVALIGFGVTVILRRKKSRIVAS